MVKNIRLRQQTKMRQIDDLTMLKNRQTKDKINQIRIKTALKTLQASRMGNKYRCRLGQSDKDIESYCINNFDDLYDI